MCEKERRKDKVIEIVDGLDDILLFPPNKCFDEIPTEPEILYIEPITKVIDIKDIDEERREKLRKLLNF